MSKILKNIYCDLFFLCNNVLEPKKYFCKDIVYDSEQYKYSASRLKINDFFIEFRAANITPKKIGQFVTLWKRSDQGPIVPYDISDHFDFFIVSVHKENQLGYFVFPKFILHKQGFLSVDDNGGKRAMRVYPPWDKVYSKQAKETQIWQLKYFVAITPEMNLAKMEDIFRIE